MVEQTQVRTYGGWRRSRGMGLMGLGPAQTLLVLAAITTMIIATTVDLTALVIVAGPCLGTLALVLLRWDGVPLLHGLQQRGRWLVGTTRGHTSYRSGVMVASEHAWQLPGVLAATTLLDIDDPSGPFGVVYNQRLGTITATLRCAATSTWLADPDQTTTWVSNWGGWLASLGYLPIVKWVAVTVESAPDPGSRLADYVSRRIVPHSPASARRVLLQLVDISRTLPGLQDSLGGCGLTVLGRATAAQLTAIVRTAFDPTARGDVTRLLTGRAGMDLSRWLDWDSAGPVMAEEHVDSYRHDSGTSVSWAWHEAPRQHVHADVLSRLLAPGPYPKRVSLIYRPLPAGEAARVVEREVNAAAFRAAYHRAQKRDESARDHADRERALHAAREEATGAGVGLMSLFVTVTVADPDDLGRAVADIESRADVAKIRLRRLRASQGAGFAATLPCGICPPQLARHWPR